MTDIFIRTSCKLWECRTTDRVISGAKTGMDDTEPQRIAEAIHERQVYAEASMGAYDGDESRPPGLVAR